MKKLLIIDTHALLHRAFHALPSLTTSSGEEVGALFGFSASLLKILELEQPQFAVAARDLPEPTFRHVEYAAYKAQREETPETLARQLARADEILAAFGIPMISRPGYEADDIIATVVRRALEQDGALQVLILSGDQDVLQLVNERVAVLAPKSGNATPLRYDAAAVQERYGIMPAQIVDFKTLVGDVSDNIKGVPGVGPKTAAALLHHFGVLEAILSAVAAKDPSLKPKTADAIASATEGIHKAKSLIALRQDVPFEFSLKSCRWSGFQKQRLAELFTKLESRSLAGRVLAVDAKKEGDALKKGSRDTSTKKKESWAERKKRFLAKIAVAEEAGLFAPFVASLERKILPAVEAMEERGIAVDRAHLSRLKTELREKSTALAEQVARHVAKPFNLASPAQVAEVLFGELAISARGVKKTSKGRISAAAPELEKLRGAHPIVPLILEWREVEKLRTTYVETLGALIDPRDGAVHTTFDTLGAATGRFSSSDPNLQNIPVRTELGRAVRNMFTAREGTEFLSSDYSQIELRVAAHLAADDVMRDIFVRGEDIHRATAAKIFKVSPAEVTPHMRFRAKAVNFGILYGMGTARLARSTGMALEEADAFIAEYFTAFPRIRAFVERMKEAARRTGFAETLFGRKRPLPGIASRNMAERAQAERVAVNMPVQGTAADLMKIAMARVWEDVLRNHKEIHLILQVHDELLFEVARGWREQAEALLKPLMERIPEFPFPLAVSFAHGARWGELI